MRNEDLAWEALVRETAANEAMERGQLNVALKAIRECATLDGISEEALPGEIQIRAQAYRSKWPHLTLTPTALSRHWRRVLVQPGRPQTAQAQALEELRRQQ